MKYSLGIIVLTLRLQVIFCQVDNIEYHEWEQIYDFKIIDGKYQFQDPYKNQLIEQDSIIFNPYKYFLNYETSDLHPDYIDSIRLTIVSRSLISYGEPILYNSDKNYIRICWFKQFQTSIERLQFDRDSTFLIMKTADADYIRIGQLTNNKKTYLSKRVAEKYRNLILKTQIDDLNSKITCPDSSINLPLTFFVEIKQGMEYNAITITECNFKYPQYKPFYKLYKSLLKMDKRH